MTLRIVDCSILQYRSLLKRPFSTSRGTTRGSTNYIVVITAEHDGRQLQGVGEAVPRRTLTGDPSTAVWPFLTAAADHLRGMDMAVDSRETCLDSIRARLAEIRAIARDLVPDGDGRQPLRGSLTGLEAALLDIGARAFDVSIAELLGGSLEPVRVTADTISAGNSFEGRAKHLADRAKRFVAWR